MAPSGSSSSVESGRTTFIAAKDIRALFTVLAGALALTLAACGGDEDRDGREGGASADKAIVEDLEPGYLDRQRRLGTNAVDLTPIDFRKRARTLAFRNAVNDFADASTGLRVPVDGIPGAVGFLVRHATVERELRAWHVAYLARGVSVLRLENSYGYGERDGIVLLPTTDKFEAIRAVGTDGINYDIENADILAWLRDLDEEHPFELTGAGIDFIEGYFSTPPGYDLDLAKRMYRFCPDIVDQGTGTVPTLAEEMKDGSLYLWWD